MTQCPLVICAGFADPDGVMNRTAVPGVRSLVCSNLENFPAPRCGNYQPRVSQDSPKNGLNIPRPETGLKCPPNQRKSLFVYKI